MAALTVLFNRDTVLSLSLKKWVSKAVWYVWQVCLSILSKEDLMKESKVWKKAEASLVFSKASISGIDEK